MIYEEKLLQRKSLTAFHMKKGTTSPMSLNLERAVFKKEKYSRDAQEVKAKAI